MTGKALFAAIIIATCGVGLMLFEANYWVVAIGILLFSPSVLSSCGAILSKKVVLNDAAVRKESAIYSNILFGILAGLIVLSHLFQLPEHLTSQENMLVALAHLSALLFLRWLSGMMFVYMYHRNRGEAK